MQSAIPLTTQQHSQQLIIGSLLVLLAAFGFSAKSILVKLAYGYSPELDAITLMLLRMAISLPFFLFVAVWSNRPSQIADSQRMRTQDWLMVMVLGFLGYYLSSLLDFEGLTYISAGLERLILYLYPTFVVLLTALFYRKAINRHQAFALILTYAGILLVYTDHQLQSNKTSGLLLGSAFVASSAMTFAIFMVGSGVLIRRIGSLRFTAYSMTVACVITGLHFIVRHGSYPLHLPVSIYGLAGIMAIFSTVLPSFLMNAGIQRIGAGSASIISSAGPIGTLVLAFFLLGEALTVAQLSGTFLVLIGVYVVSRAKH